MLTPAYHQHFTLLDPSLRELQKALSVALCRQRPVQDERLDGDYFIAGEVSFWDNDGDGDGMIIVRLMYCRMSDDTICPGSYRRKFPTARGTQVIAHTAAREFWATKFQPKETTP